MARKSLQRLPVSHRAAPPARPSRPRRLIHRGADLVVLVALLAGALVLWVGMPVGWLWLGSQLQPRTSLALALLVMLVGVIVSVAVILAALTWLTDRHRAIQLAQGHQDPGRVALEIVVASSATIAVAGFAVWFFGFAGTSPVPFF